MKAALLGSTLLALAGPVLAQTAPADDWNIGVVTNIANNDAGGNVTFTGDLNVAAVLDGTMNSISAAAVGASGSFSMRLYTDGNAAPTSSVSIDQVKLTGDNDATVMATANVVDANIANGTLNSISAAAVGAAASMSITTVAEGATAEPATEVLVGATGPSQITATNTSTGAVTLEGNFSSGTDIADGVSNSISRAAVGASASLSYTSVDTAGSASTETVTVDDAVLLTSSNAAAVRVVGNDMDNPDLTDDTATLVPLAKIADGTSNSISTAAVGASSSLSITQVTDGTDTAPERTVNIAAGTLDIDVDATNTGAVSLLGQMGTTDDPDDAPTISLGTSNSISMAAVGASGSVSYTGVHSGGATTAGTLDDTLNVADGGIIELTVRNDTGGTVITTASAFGANIQDGVSNSISLAAVGSSASSNFTTIVDGVEIAAPNDPTAPATLSAFGEFVIGSTNKEVVTFTGALGTTGVAADAPTIAAGTMNSISLAGVGASASSGFTSINTGGSASGQEVNFGKLSSTATNTGGVTVTASAHGSTITAGTSKSISMAAVGAVASTSFTLISR
jgi:hypothetical protein